MPNEKSTNTKPSALKTRRIVSKETTGTNSVRFPYFEAETMSGDEYRQNSKILFERAITKKRDPDAMVYHPDLAPTPPIFNGERQTEYEWPSTIKANFQTDMERSKARLELQKEREIGEADDNGGQKLTEWLYQQARDFFGSLSFDEARRYAAQLALEKRKQFFDLIYKEIGLPISSGGKRKTKKRNRKSKKNKNKRNGSNKLR